MRTLRLAAALLLALAPSAGAFNQPALNLGSTSFLDGGPAKPGLYMIEYVVFIDGAKAYGNDGTQVPGGASVSALTLASQFAWHSPLTLGPGRLGGHVTVPLVSATAKGALGPVPLPVNTAGFGDLTVGPYIQFNEGTLLGGPLGHRLEFDLILPTGKYDPAFAVNPGSNHLTYNPFYALTWHFARGWEATARVQYAWHRENRATGIQPGHAFHSNLAVSKEVHPKLRLGAAGYVLQQTTDDRLRGSRLPDARERVLALGPGLVYQAQGFYLMLTNPFEFGVRNRFGGSRSVLQLLHRF